MTSICKPSDFLMNVLQLSKNSAGDLCRLLIFCIKVKVEEGWLLYNTLTQELLLIDNFEEEHILQNVELKQKWFVVANDFDDFKFARQIRNLAKKTMPVTPGITSYTVLTTTDCNARCFYCFELKRERINMSLETADKVAAWMRQNYQTLCEYNNTHPGVLTKSAETKPSIHISWFGGEPLYNMPIIDHITSKLKDSEVNYVSRMISNGYLFNEETIDKAKNGWNLKSVQITLDGTEKVYNRCKAFIYKNANPYLVVMHNIRLLLEAKIKVIVRLNIDVHNAKDLIELIDILHTEFSEYEQLSVYSHPLFEIDEDGNTPKPRTEARRAEVYRLYQELEQKIQDCGFGAMKRLPKMHKTNKCMSDNRNSVVVLPTGHLGRCEHFSDSDYYAHIDDPLTIDTAMYKSFEEIRDILPQCNDCAFFPMCTELKKCPDETTCYPEIKNDKIRKLEKSMLYEYQLWKAKETACEDEIEENNETDPNC